MTYSISLSLFVALNPSIDAKAAGGCSASIVPGNAYCMSRVIPLPVSGPTGPTYKPTIQGCYGNEFTTPSTYSPVLLGSSWTDSDSNMTIDACARFCAADGYTLAGLRFTNSTCFCGSQISLNARRLYASNSSCLPVNEKYNPTTITLYTLSLDDNPKPTRAFFDVGCFPPEALRLTSDPEDRNHAVWPTNNTISACAAFCLEEDWWYFGVTNGDTCRCGYSRAYSWEVPAVDTEENCNVPCPGQANTDCGGKEAMHIFHPSPLSHLSQNQESSGKFQLLAVIPR